MADPPAAALPPEARPRLLPTAVLFRRPDDELQIGLDPGVRLRDRSGRWRQLLSRLDGSRTWREIAGDIRTHDLTELGRLLSTLASLGLADLGAPGAADIHRGRIRLVGGGPLALAIGDRLLASGVERLYVVDLPGHHRPLSRLRDEAGERVVPHAHWTKPESPAVALSVLVAETLEVDRGIAAELVRRDAPHLVVRLRPAGVVIGPLVVPGRTGCLHCSDLRRRDTDAGWPQLLGQLERSPAPPPAPAVSDWAAAMTTIQVLGFLGGNRPETWGATLELAAADHAMAWRAWPAHADCGCRWPGTVVSA